MELELERLNVTNETSFDTSTLYAVTVPLFIRIVAAVVSLFSTTSNILVVLTVIRYQILHSRTHWYIVNWCLCNVFITASLPYMFDSLGLDLVANGNILCIWDENVFNFLTWNHIFVAVIIIDWYISTFCNQRRCAVRCRNSFKIIISLIWAMLIILLITTSSLCFLRKAFLFPFVAFEISYLCIFILLLAIFILRCVKLKTSSIIVEKNKLELKLAFSYFITWLPNILVEVFSIVLRQHLSYASISILLFTSMLVGYSHANVLLIVLYITDRNFKVCLNSMFHIKTSDDNKNNIGNKQDLVEILDQQ